MFTSLFFAVSPLLSYAQHNQQTPLKEDQSRLIIPLTLSGDGTYTFESALDGPTRLSSKTIKEVESYRNINALPQSILISIPFDPTRSGSLVLDDITPNNALIRQEMDWIDTLIPGHDVPLTHVGIRKGAMISMDAYATRLALETPYISLPNEIYDVLIQATNATPHQHSAGDDDVVDCSLLERFPDLVIGLQTGTDDEEESEDIVDSEIVITPKQYVLETEKGQCVLLVQRDGAEIVLGWAAIRGRDVVLDWLHGRTGFAR
ncbi:hypothetical protein SVAN01_01124 [Stagonosporopsis vannaccii]|nr:hypothetical protein SVAN01_01124 [Stagonosporopsis vannaccii]